MLFSFNIILERNDSVLTIPTQPQIELGGLSDSFRYTQSTSGFKCLKGQTYCVAVIPLCCGFVLMYCELVGDFTLPFAFCPLLLISPLTVGCLIESKYLEGRPIEILTESGRLHLL